jgi:hypothetical protein
MRAEWSLVPINLVLIAVAVVVASRRWRSRDVPRRPA